MRIRSGHILLGAGALICAAVVAVVVVGGGTQATVDNTADSQAALPPAGSNPDATPEIEVETTTKDMGVVSNKEKTRKPFVIRNKGKAVLQIRNVTTSCACTQPIFPNEGLAIQPGTEGSFEIEIDPYRIPGFEATRYLTITSSDQHKPQIQVSVTSHVDPEFKMEPEVLDFGDVTKGDAPTRTMVITQLQDAFEIREINTFGLHKNDPKAAEKLASPDEFSFQVVKRPESAWKTPGKAEWELTVGLTPETRPGDLEVKHVFAMTTVPRLPAMPIALKGHVVAPYKLDPALPQRLNIKMNTASGTFDPAFATVTAQAPVSIEDIHAASPSVSASIEPTASATGTEAKLRVTITDAAPPGPLEEAVTFNIVIDGKKYPERVGVRSYITAKPTQ